MPGGPANHCTKALRVATLSTRCAITLSIDKIRPDPTRPDPTRPDPTRPDPTRHDPTRPDPTRSDPIRSDPIRSDPTIYHRLIVSGLNEQNYNVISLIMCLRLNPASIQSFPVTRHWRRLCAHCSGRRRGL